MHYPSSALQVGQLFFLTARKCGIFGVHCEGLAKQVNYLIDEGMASGKGSNAVISYLHHFFNNYGVGETNVDLHCDNCSGQNKNNFMLWYCAWRTIHQMHVKLGVHLLIAGHTKFGPDWCFGLFKQVYRRSRVDTLADIATVMAKSSEEKGVNLSQLVGHEDGRVLVDCFDWQNYLTPYFRKLPQIKSYQHFR